jgi:hypothetical protein
MNQIPFTAELIAPCGMNCGVCKAYNAYIHNVPKQRGKVTHCTGCLLRAKNCYIKRGCKKLSAHKIKICSLCDTLPCKHLAHLDKRYRERYGMSMVENLKELKNVGMEAFLRNQAEKYRCSLCGGVVSVHDKKCYSCGKTQKSLIAH